MCVVYVFAVYAHVFVDLCAYLHIWRSQLEVCRPALSPSILLSGIRLAARKLKWSSCLWLPQHWSFKHGFLHGHEGFELMDLCLHIKLCCLLRHFPSPECKNAEEFVLSWWRSSLRRDWTMQDLHFSVSQTLDGFINDVMTRKQNLVGGDHGECSFEGCLAPVSHSLLPGHVGWVASSTHFSCHNILLRLRNNGASLPQANCAEAGNSDKSLLLSCLFRHLSQSDQHSFLSWHSWSRHLGMEGEGGLEKEVWGKTILWISVVDGVALI